MQYFIVPNNIAEQWQGVVENGQGISFVKDVQGRYVINTGVAEQWPAIPWADFEIEVLTDKDFPKYDD